MNHELATTDRGAPLALPSADMTPAEVMRGIWESYRPRTRRAYQQDFAAFLAFLGAPQAVDEGTLPKLLRAVRPNHVAKWKSELDARCAPSTVARKLAGVRAVLGACVEVGWIRTNPATGRRFKVSAPKRNPAMSAPTVEQFLKLARFLEHRSRINLVGKRNMAIFLWLTFAAARVEDVVTLTCATWRAARSTSKGAKIVMMARKGGDEKSVHPPPLVVAWTNSYLRERAEGGRLKGTGVVFCQHGGRREGKSIDGRSVWSMISRAAKTCGFRSRPHAMRHFFATESLDRGAPLEDVRAALGHKSTTTTRIYDDAVRPATAWEALGDVMAKIGAPE